MKILCIDTASDICGVSILENTNLVVNLDNNTGRTHSENLMPMIQEALKKSNLSLKDINLLVCDKGPGSFTGIRIGISTVKAFHDSLNIPCIGISALESLSYNVKNDGLIASIIDCKNDNCYFALYKLENSNYTQIIEPTATSILDTLVLCKNAYCSYPLISTNLAITFVGDVNIYKSLITSYFDSVNFSENNCLSSYNLGLAGFKKFEQNIFDEILPLYLKKPQAERQLEENQLKLDYTNLNSKK